MYQVYTPVQVTDTESEHAGKVGVNLSAQEPVTVRFEDGTTAEFELKQLKGL